MKKLTNIKASSLQLSVVLAAAMYSTSALAFTTELLTSSTAVAIARPTFGVMAAIAALIAIVRIVNESNESSTKLIVSAIILGSLASQYKAIMEAITSLF